MATESHPIPRIARTALALLQQQFQQSVNEIGKQAIEALGLDASLNYNVNFDANVITRSVPDIEPPKEG